MCVSTEGSSVADYLKYHDAELDQEQNLTNKQHTFIDSKILSEVS